jgi:hypothetical protein
MRSEHVICPSQKKSGSIKIQIITFVKVLMHNYEILSARATLPARCRRKMARHGFFFILPDLKSPPYNGLSKQNMLKLFLKGGRQCYRAG